ncbi:MAG TPA: DUF2231 domain-containing protein [Thermoanaerobaculia bacterium]|nr:DUF2231 domain-containing protein [Thermoanaerobaculia bacterium]
MIEHLLPGLGHLQNLHPLVVHYPIAFLGGAAAFYVAALLSRNERLAIAAFWMLLAGTAGALIAIGTGLRASEGVMVAKSVRAALLDQHETLMIITGSMAFALSAWAIVARPFPARGRLIFVALLIAMVGVLIKGADYGGRMVYDYNAGGAACGQPIEFEK